MTRISKSCKSPTEQRGASLFTALIMLLALSVVSLASLTTSLMELRMANNAEAGMSAFQFAQAGIDAALTDESNNFVVTGTVGNTRCTPKVTTACTTSMAAFPTPAENTAVRITRVTDKGCPPRTRNSASSCAKQSAATFVTESSYDGTLVAQGKADLTLGYIKLLPGTNQNIVTSPTPTGSKN